MGVEMLYPELVIALVLIAYFMWSTMSLVEFIILLPFLIDTSEESDRRSTVGRPGTDERF